MATEIRRIFVSRHRRSLKEVAAEANRFSHVRNQSPALAAEANRLSQS
jgi:hypothetical protein